MRDFARLTRDRSKKVACATALALAFTSCASAGQIAVGNQGELTPLESSAEDRALSASCLPESDGREIVHTIHPADLIESFVDGSVLELNAAEFEKISHMPRALGIAYRAGDMRGRGATDKGAIRVEDDAEIIVSDEIADRLQRSDLDPDSVVMLGYRSDTSHVTAIAVIDPDGFVEFVCAPDATALLNRASAPSELLRNAFVSDKGASAVKEHARSGSSVDVPEWADADPRRRSADIEAMPPGLYDKLTEFAMPFEVDPKIDGIDGLMVCTWTEVGWNPCTPINHDPELDRELYGVVQNRVEVWLVHEWFDFDNQAGVKLGTVGEKDQPLAIRIELKDGAAPRDATDLLDKKNSNRIVLATRPLKK